MLFIYIIGISIYFVLKYNNQKNKNFNDNSPVGSSLLEKIILLVVFVSSVVSNYFVANQVCNNLSSSNEMEILSVSIFPWLILAVIVSIIKYLLPGWKLPFSDTFGYLVVYFQGAENTLVEVLEKDGGMKKKLLKKIYDNTSLLLNVITPNNFDKKWKEISNKIQGSKNSDQLNKTGGQEKNTSSNGGMSKLKTDLWNVILLKDLIGEYVWWIIIGLSVIMYQTQRVANMKCMKTVIKSNNEQKSDKSENANDAGSSETDEPSERVYNVS
ncbi:hypothetical protein [uncultured Mediterranean phage]|nr:hypothetical protein [uncultured Mediterranean phage]